MNLNDITPEHFEADAIQKSLATYVSIPKDKYREMEMMIETMYMMRDDLIGMGLLSQTVPPMFYVESIAGNIQKLIREKKTETIRECARIACSYDAEPWKHTPAYAHVADMVSVEIGNTLHKLAEGK